MKKTRIAFIGLGNMGYPMAGHLAAAGYNVRVFNRTQAVAERWLEEHAGEMAVSVAEAVVDADFVMMCVGNDDDLREVAMGAQGAIQHMRSGALLIDHTTSSAGVARELAEEAEEWGVGFMDAPVSGGQLGAQKGELTIMCGANEADFVNAEKILACYSIRLRRMGDVGAGQLAKMVNQICVAGLLQGLAEGMHFAERNGLDVAAVMEVISQGAAASWQMQNRYKTMIEREFDFGFAVKWMRKDLGYVLAEARRSGASLPVTALVDQFYADVESMGGAGWDTSSLIQRLRAQ